jgi:hypothetical protein
LLACINAMNEEAPDDFMSRIETAAGVEGGEGIVILALVLAVLVVLLIGLGTLWRRKRLDRLGAIVSAPANATKLPDPSAGSASDTVEAT